MLTASIVSRWGGLTLSWALTGAVLAQNAPPPATLPAPATNPIRADLQADRTIIQAGQPVWVTFTLTNLTADPITLKVPEIPAAEETGAPGVGLPLAHVFSGPHYTGVTVQDQRGEQWDQQVSFRPVGPVPVVRLAPYGSVGIRVDLRQYYRAMQRPGKYQLVWRPYFAAVESAPLHIHILAERQAVILTEFGPMTIRFYYEQAPMAVQNFLELAEQRFYDNLTFHKVIPNALIQGGDPRGDGRGGRPDGKRLKAEFSRIPFEAGTVGMARLPSDPDSASSQFFITTSRQPAFDGNQTAFGYLVGQESFETLRKIASVPTDGQGRPLKPVTIRAITLDNVPGREPEIAGFERRSQAKSPGPAIMNGVTGPEHLAGTDLPVLTTRPAGTGG